MHMSARDVSIARRDRRPPASHHARVLFSQRPSGPRCLPHHPRLTHEWVCFYGQGTAPKPLLPHDGERPGGMHAVRCHGGRRRVLIVTGLRCEVYTPPCPHPSPLRGAKSPTSTSKPRSGKLYRLAPPWYNPYLLV